MSKYAQVKYLLDGCRATVPTSFFKVVFQKTLPAAELCIGNVYQVFWSPESDETPADVMEDNNEILDIDDLPDLERDRRRRLSGGPLKGFYNSLLVSLSDNEGVERELKRELSDSNCLDSGVKRSRVPSSIAIESNPKFKSSQQPVNSKNVSKKVEKQAAVEASRRNLTSLFNKCHDLKPKKSRRDESGEEESADYWKRKYLESKNRSSSKTKNKESSSGSGIKDSSSGIGIKDSSSGSGIKKKQKFDKVSQSSVESDHDESPQDLDVKDDDSKDNSDNEMQIDNESSKRKDKISKDNSDKVEKDNDEWTGDQSLGSLGATASHGGETDETDDEDEITPKKIYRSIPNGKEGDSTALYQFVDQLWDQKTIIKRSPTGLAACSKNKTVGYPRLTPQKVKQCEDFLRKRVLEEKSSASQAEIDMRVGRTRYILGQKISSLRKAYRRKGIEVPSAEEAQDEKKKMKKMKKKE